MIPNPLVTTYNNYKYNVIIFLSIAKKEGNIKLPEAGKHKSCVVVCHIGYDKASTNLSTSVQKSSSGKKRETTLSQF